MLLNCGNTLSLWPCSGLGFIESCYWNFWLYSLDTWGSGGAEIFFERTFKQTDKSLSLKPTHPLQPHFTPLSSQASPRLHMEDTVIKKLLLRIRSEPPDPGWFDEVPAHLSASSDNGPTCTSDQWSSFPLRSLELSTTSCSRTRSFSATSNVQLDISRWVSLLNHDSAGTVG